LLVMFICSVDHWLMLPAILPSWPDQAPLLSANIKFVRRNMNLIWRLSGACQCFLCTAAKQSRVAHPGKVNPESRGFMRAAERLA